MKRLIFILALCLPLAACDRTSDKAGVETIAQCIADTASPAEQESLGRRASMAKEGYPVHLARFDQLSCRGAKGLLDNNATMDAQGLAVSAKLLPSRDFRRGVQTTAWRQAGQLPARAEELASLVIQQGENTVTRAWARTCDILSDDKASILRDMEAPYLTAYVGTRGWVQDQPQAQAMAATIAEQSKSHALFEATAGAKGCDDVGMKHRYDLHLAAMKALSQGTNPLVRGCKVQPNAGELVLDCSQSGRL